MTILHDSTSESEFAVFEQARPLPSRTISKLLLASALGGVAYLVAGAQPAHAQFVCDSAAAGESGGGASAAGTNGIAANVACGTDANANGTGATAGNTAFGKLANASGNSGRNVAVGFGANANGFGARSVAIGDVARADGLSGFNVAIGDGPDARGELSFNIAIGQSANASGNGGFNIAIGRNSNANGVETQNTAIGNEARATGANASAFGSRAIATHSNSAAFGNGATTSRDDQQVFGTADNTYTMAGLTSAASATAQGAPTRIVTSNETGDLAARTVTELGLATSDDVSELQGKATDNMMAIQSNTAAIGNLDSRVSGNEKKIDENAEGAALALAMAGTFLPQPGESVRISGNWGNFEGSNAVAFSGAMALGTQTFLTAGVGVGLEEDTVGGRAGVSYGW